MKRRLLAVLALSVLLLAACSNDDNGGGGSTGATGGGATGGGNVTVGVSWNNFNEPRWANFDEPAIQDALAQAHAGDTLNLHAGRYRVPNGLVVGKSVVIRSAGIGRASCRERV